jgi:hypothetical protein
MGDYAQSEEYLQKAQYQLAVQYQEQQQNQQATALFLALGDYEDAQERYRQMRLQAAQDALNRGDLSAAIDLLENIRSYANADELYTGSVYQLARQMAQEGELGEAARLYALIPEYKDAAELRDSHYDEYFEDAYRTAQAAMKQKDYLSVIKALSGLDREHTGEKYQDIQQMYQEANYLYADALYADNKPYEALVYYRNILEYKDVKTRKLNRTPYRIIGKWESTKGVVFEFRDDGTCLMDGKELYYFARNYSLMAGDRPEKLDIAYRIVNLRDNSLSIQNQKNKVLYKCTRVE